MGTEMKRVVVIGASVAGLAAAAGLAERFDEVIVLERRPMPEPGATESIVAQGRFPHVLLAGGSAALERLVPGLTQDLFAHGAVGDIAGGVPRPCHWWAEGAVRTALPDLGVAVPLCSRALLETRLRTHVEKLANVTVRDRLVARGLVVDRDRIAAATVERDGQREKLSADLVVDASGRPTRSPAWLEANGMAQPPVSQVEVGVTYTAVEVRRRSSDLDGGLFAVVQNTAHLARIGVALPAEGDRWKIVLGGYFGDAAPTDRAGILSFAASLPDPAMLHLLENEWLGEPTQYKFGSSQRRHWEKVRGLPAGFCAVGDAVASFNPLYGQGMSAAAMQAESLVRCLDQTGNDRRLPAAVARAAAKVAANPWQIATGADFIYSQTQGPKMAGTGALNGYLARVMVAAAHDEAVNLALTRVQQLLASPRTLLSPGVVGRVRRACGRANRVLAAVPA